MSRLISYKIYKMFAKSYNINVTHVVNNKRKYKMIKQLRMEIYNFELNNKNKYGVGLYFF